MSDFFDFINFDGFAESALGSNTVHSTIYSDIVVASDGSFMSTREADYMASVGMDNLPIHYDMDAACTPSGAAALFSCGAVDNNSPSTDVDQLVSVILFGQHWMCIDRAF